MSLLKKLKINDLRIDNVLMANKTPIVITSIDGKTDIINAIELGGNCLYIRSLKLVEPIILDSNWLDLLGFDKCFHSLNHMNRISHYNINGFRIDVEYYDNKDEVCYYECSQSPSIDLMYVHQLQNLFFAHTGDHLGEGIYEAKRKKAKKLSSNLNKTLNIPQ